MQSIKHKSWYIYAALTLIIALPFTPFLFGYFTATGDTQDVYIPLESFFRSQALQGTIPSWNPDIAWGFPVIAAAQIGFFYPPLLLLRFLPLSIYLPLAVILHLLLAALGFYVYVRSLQVSKTAAIIGSTAFTLSGFIIQHITHLNILFCISWFPIQLFATYKISKLSNIRFHHVGLLAILLALPFAVGQIQLPLLQAAYVSIYLLALRRKKTQIKKGIGQVIIIALITFALAAPQLLPTAELFTQSTRSTDSQFQIERANQHSFPIYHIQTALFPRFFGNDDTYWGKRLEIEYGFFIGTIPLTLALYYIFKKKKKDWQDKWHVWLAAISFLLALGSSSPFRLIRIEPSLWIFSAPARWLMFTTLGLSILAAFSFDYVLANRKSFVKTVKVFSVILLLIVILWNIGISTINQENVNKVFGQATNVLNLELSKQADYYTEKLSSILTSVRSSSISLASPYTYIPLIILLAVPYALKHKHAQYILLGLTAAELICITSTTSPLVPLSTILRAPNTVQELPENVRLKQARVISRMPDGDTGAYLTNPDSRISVEERLRLRQLLPGLTQSQFNIASVAWPASLDIAAHASVLEKIQDNQSFPYVNGKEAATYNIGAALAIDPTTNEPNITKIDAKPRAYIKDTGTTATYEEISPTKQVVTTTVSENSSLVITNTYYPGWEATVNNNPATITPTEDQFISLPVPKGSNTVELTYTPKPMYAGIALSVITLAVCGAAIYKNRKELIS